MSGENINKSTNIQHISDELTPEKRGCGVQVMADSLHFMKAGLEAIIEDDVTVRFISAKPPTWNLLTRTRCYFTQFKHGWKVNLLWMCGLVFRYLVLFPLRFGFFLLGVALLAAVTTLLGISGSQTKVHEKAITFCYKVLAFSITAKVHFHNRRNMTKEGGIVVANHTSPLDACLLSTDQAYSLIGQQHGGFLGFFQRAMSKASSHIWFDRGDAKERGKVTKRLREHVEDKTKLPILIFPEGTCINNTSVMLFRKGAFEVSKKVYPVAMKYDSRFGDAFWNSAEHSFGTYILRMMTSWAIVVHVWYLPAMERMEGEGAIEFASRVKGAIAKCAGLKDMEWDGFLKRARVPPQMVAKVQARYAQWLISLVPISDSDLCVVATMDKGARCS